MYEYFLVWNVFRYPYRNLFSVSLQDTDGRVASGFQELPNELDLTLKVRVRLLKSSVEGSHREAEVKYSRWRLDASRFFTVGWGVWIRVLR